MNNRKPVLIIPSTEITRTLNTSGRPLLNSVTATVQTHSINAHNHNDPSCAPQTAEIRYMTGNIEFELLAT